MRILALETTEAIGSVAAMADGKLLLQLDLDRSLRSAQSLAPAIKELLEGVGWRPAEVQLVAATTGPGSFTGLRVGVATAKTFAYAVGAEVLGIDTLATIAGGIPAEALAGSPAVACAVDAQRGEVVANTFHRNAAGEFAAEGPNRLIDADGWLASLPRGMAVAGPVLGKLAARLPEGLVAVDAAYWRPTAATVARLAHRDYQSGRRQDLWTLLPVYSRQSAAEEKRCGRQSP